MYRGNLGEGAALNVKFTVDLSQNTGADFFSTLHLLSFIFEIKTSAQQSAKNKYRHFMKSPTDG